MASLGNIGHDLGASGLRYGAQFFQLDKAHTSVTMPNVGDSEPSAIPFAYAVLTRNSVVNWRTRCDASGKWNFYDMDDSGGQVYSIATYTQAGATGEAWTATVVGDVVVVTQQFTSNRTRSSSFG